MKLIKKQKMKKKNHLFKKKLANLLKMKMIKKY